jgi:hypothetical protein
MDNSTTLRDSFRKALGIKEPESTHKCPPITINGQEWYFSLRKCERPQDVVWMYVNVDFIMGQSEGISMANQTLLNMAQAALATVAVNGVPLYKFVGVKPTEEEMEKINDAMNPPDRVRWAASQVFMKEYLQEADDYTLTPQKIEQWLFVPLVGEQLTWSKTKIPRAKRMRVMVRSLCRKLEESPSGRPPPG